MECHVSLGCAIAARRLQGLPNPTHWWQEKLHTVSENPVVSSLSSNLASIVPKHLTICHSELPNIWQSEIGTKNHCKRSPDALPRVSQNGTDWGNWGLAVRRSLQCLRRTLIQNAGGGGETERGRRAISVPFLGNCPNLLSSLLALKAIGQGCL